MTTEKLVIVSISLTKEEARQFKELHVKGSRGASDQFRLLLRFYLENKDKVK